MSTMNWVRKMMHFMSLHYVKKKKFTFKFLMSQLLKVQRDWVFIDAHLLFRRKSLQKSTVLYKLVEICLYCGSLVKFPLQTVSALKDNFQGSKQDKENLCLFRLLIISQYPNAVFPGMAPQFHILLSSWDHVIIYSWKNY